MRNAMVTSALVLLTLLSSVSASPWVRRQESSALDSDATASASASASKTEAPSAASTVSQEAKGTGASDSAPVNGTAEASSSTANSTTTPTASSAAAASSTAAIDPDDPKSSPTCHINADTAEDHDPTDLMPFCSPEKNEQLRVGTKYPITWDPSHFSSKTITLELKLSNDLNGPNKWSQDDVPNSPGTYDIQLFPDLLHGENNTQFTLFALDGPTQFSGPVFSLITNATTKGHKKGDDRVGEKAGIPVGLGIFLIAVAGLLFWFIRRRRGQGKKGYLANRSARGVGGGGDGGFRDEPTRGMELQDRNGASREDSWEAGWGDEGTGRNQFRDEIERQRRR
ncbi:MAG: hypothetical protein LQ351_006791 [Letrouitia transgressa]|nr:MAG: hypothetical protein LQ351_006791 [Letrouitia transgressa]